MNYDKLLDIETEEFQLGFNKSYHYHRYEPTPYDHLEKLFHEFPLYETDHVVDFGCGKGRLNFFIHYLFQATVTGIEMNEEFYQDALVNLEQYTKRRKRSKEKIRFYLGTAEDYLIRKEENYFYFFNPFSIQIFRRIISNIMYSLEEGNREVRLILYFPSDEYRFFMENHPSFSRVGEVQVGKNKDKDQFIIYKSVY
ncbi:class I SAM-dependent methyltransferase [Niallia sp. JL1B1071]|uniref:class I SAM-dependent methyltransferase n=1 Tax=Niallia tiangongensis TaxID=3237105 RepID=UPI0037DC5106